MTEALLLVVVGSLVPISVATLVVAVLALRKAQLYVESVEQRLESFHEGQILLLALLRERSRSSEGEQEQLAQEHGVQGQERMRQERDRLALAVRTRRDAEQGIGGPEPNLPDVSVGPERRSPLAEGPRDDAAGGREPADEKTRQKGRGTEPRPRAANFPDTATSRPAKTPPDEGTRRAVWHPHPDDDVSPTRAGEPGDATIEMFRRHYDKYLENYEGYVKLAARLYRMRDEAEAPPGSAAEREWEGRLRRVTDGIERTTSRLDILEEYNPELATDDRISRRASIARSQRELEIKRRER